MSLSHITTYMGPALLSAVISNDRLTSREGQGQTKSKFRHQAGISYGKNVAGIDQARRNTVPKGVTLRASFFMHGTSSMVGREGCYSESSSDAHAGSLFRSLVGPHGSPPVYDQRTDGDYTKPSTESIIMANATTKGAIRPKNTQTRISANGTVDTITWVREATAEKRLRRYLKAQGQYLVKSKPGTATRIIWGEYAILDANSEIVRKNADLESCLRDFGLLADDERIDPPLHKGWRFYIARYEEIEVDGIKTKYAKPLTRDYSTEKAAIRAAEGIEDREGLLICSFDTRQKGGTNNANP